MKTLNTILFIATCLCSGAGYCVCTQTKAETTLSSRFALDNAEVFDKMTKFVWSRCSVGTTWRDGKCGGTPRQMNLGEAKQHALKAVHRWRVPTINELSGHACPVILASSQQGLPHPGSGPFHPRSCIDVDMHQAESLEPNLQPLVIVRSDRLPDERMTHPDCLQQNQCPSRRNR